MNRKLLFIILILFFAGIVVNAVPGKHVYNKSIIEKVRLQDNDIPRGFVYGKIPQFAKKVLKGNPWSMDRTAIARLAKNIYPDGNYRAIQDIHMSILTRKEQPFGDDIVCYILFFKDRALAKKELHKLKEYVHYNKDRALILEKKNMVVFLHVDDVQDYSLMEIMSEKIKGRMDLL